MITPMNPPSGQDVQELLHTGERLVNRIRDKLQELVDKVDGLLSSLPSIRGLVADFVVEGVRAAIRTMYELFARLVTTMQEYFRVPGRPSELFEAGERWLREVGGPSAETEDRINTDSLHVDDYWTGSAARAYHETLETQQSAFAAMVEVARTIKECLDDAAWGIVKFWVAVGVGLVSALAGVIAAVVAVVGIVSAPAAILAAAGAVLALLAVVSAGAWAAFVELQSIKDQADALRTERRYSTAFAGDRWPAATARGEWAAD